MTRRKGNQITQNTFLVWCLFWGPFLINPFMQFLRLPSFVKYLLDVFWVFLVATMVTRKKKTIDPRVKFLMIWVFLFLLITAFNYLVHYQSIFYYLWGIRNNFRGYALFFAVIFYFEETDVRATLKILDKLFYLNAALMFFQRFILLIEGDYLGGLLGTEPGANGYTNIFFCVVLAIGFVQYCGGQKKTIVFIIQVLLSLFLAGMAELKFFFVEFVILMVVGSTITKLSWKKITVIPVLLVIFLIGYNTLGILFPGSNMTIAELFDYASNSGGYTGSGDFNRLNFLGTSNSMFLTTTVDRLFGLGLGNCDLAAYAIVTSPFYRQYGYLHYNWFSSAFMYLENGWLGLIFFFGFFVIIFLDMMVMIREKKGNRSFCQIAALCAIAAAMSGFYNQSLRTEAGYMMYFILAIPWCVAYEGNKMPKKRRLAVRRAGHAPEPAPQANQSDADQREQLDVSGR